MLVISKYLYSVRNNYSIDIKITGKSEGSSLIYS